MNKVVAFALLATATGYTLIIAFLVVFTFSFFGMPDPKDDLFGITVLCLLAFSPAAVWPYCIKRAKAWLRGRQPPF